MDGDADALSGMTREALWQLFPIVLRAPDPAWAAWERDARRALAPLLPANARLHWIGSTAIGGIWAKPTVDFLLEADLADHPATDDSLRRAGWRCMAETASRRDYNMGYTPRGFAERVYHLHLRGFGDCDELFFRDYLRAHPEVAKAYEALKLSLWKPYAHDRDGYTAAKGAFVRYWTEIAKREA